MILSFLRLGFLPHRDLIMWYITPKQAFKALGENSKPVG